MLDYLFLYSHEYVPRVCILLFKLKIQGTFKSSVSLFNRTAKKDLVSSVQGLNANRFVLCDLLSPIGIKVCRENTLK
jgi:hypothetical protein